MKLVGILFGYALAVAGLSIALFGPLFWLVTPDPTLRVDPRVAPVPPRIAESIERKRAPPAEQPAALAEMNEAPAALPEVQVPVALPVDPAAKKRAPSTPPATSRKSRQPAQRKAREFVPSPPQPVTTARTDFPF